MSDAPKLLLSAREAAAALCVCPKTLWSLTVRGDLPCLRIGRRVLYSPAALNEWIAHQTTTQQAEGNG